MKELNSNWVTEGIIDFEYKKYILLAYLRSAEASFDARKIYPFLGDLITHYRNLVALKERKDQAEQQFPKQLSHLDFENFRLEYERMMEDDACMEEIRSIVEYAIPRIYTHIGIGREIYDAMEDNMDITSVGIMPVRHDAGYLLFRTANYTSTKVYAYELTIFEHFFEKFRGLRTNFVDSYPKKIYNYDEAIKLDLIRRNRSMPNPATFAITAKKPFPFEETFFPVARRSFVRFLGLQEQYDNNNK